MYESISKNNELENEMTLDMSYFWYSDAIFIFWGKVREYIVMSQSDAVTWY